MAISLPNYPRTFLIQSQLTCITQSTDKEDEIHKSISINSKYYKVIKVHINISTTSDTFCHHFSLSAFSSLPQKGKYTCQSLQNQLRSLGTFLIHCILISLCHTCKIQQFYCDIYILCFGDCQFGNFQQQNYKQKMTQASLKAKVLNYFNPDPTLPITNSRIPRSNTASHLTRSHDLTHSQSSINRNSYLNNEDILAQHISNKLTTNRSQSNKKQKLNVVSNPNRLILTPKNNKSDSRIQYNESKKLLERSRNKYSRLQSSRIKDKDLKIDNKRSRSLKSFNTVQIKIEGQAHRVSRPTLILKEKIVPVHIRTINNPQQQLLPDRFVKTEVSQPQTPVRRLNLPNEIINQRQFSPYRPPLVLNHDLPLQRVIRVIQKRQIPFTFQAPQSFKPLSQVKTNVIGKDSKMISHSPSGFIRHQKCPPSPIINVEQKGVETPLMVLTPPTGSSPNPAPASGRSSSESMLERSLTNKGNVIFDEKFKDCDLTGKIIPNSLKMNSQQKVLTLLSQNILPIRSRQQAVELNLDKSQAGQTSSQPNSHNISIEPKQQLNQIAEIPLSVPLPIQIANTNYHIIRQQSKHKLQLSPSPVKHQPREDTNCSLTKQYRQVLEDQPKISPLLELSNGKNRQRKQNNIATVAQSNTIRQNHFINQLSQELDTIQNQRLQKQNSIAKRLQELSQRATSMVRMHSQESRRSPDPPTKEQPLATCSMNPKTKSLSLCVTQSQQTFKTYNLTSEAMKLSFAPKEKQDLDPLTNTTRNQILTKLLL